MLLTGIIDDLWVVVADLMLKSAKKKLVKKSGVSTDTNSDSTKAEIVKFKEFKKDVEKELSSSSLNVEFTTESDDDKDMVMSDDEVSNYIEDITSKVIETSNLNLDDTADISRVKIIILAMMIADARAKYTAKISREFLPHREALIEFNTVYKFLTGVKFFVKESAIDLREVVTSQLLFDTAKIIYESDEFKDDLVMTGMIERIRKRLEMENAGMQQQDDVVEAVSPIIFNNGILNMSFDNSKAKISETKTEYITNYLLGLMDQKFVSDNSVSIELTPRGWINDSIQARDTGSVTVTIKCFDSVYRMLVLDLDTITGSGYSLEIPTYADNEIRSTYVSMEKHSHIVSKYMQNENYILNNPNDPESVHDYLEVIQITYGPEIYKYYDMSGMSKHIEFMTNEEFITFGNNLAKIRWANWTSLGGASQYRMRIRNFKNPDEFTLVSDRNTRQQLPEMQPVFGGKPKQYSFYKNIEDPDNIASSDILVCKFKDNQIDVTVNGSAVPGIKIPEIPEPIDMSSVVK